MNRPCVGHALLRLQTARSCHATFRSDSFPAETPFYSGTGRTVCERGDVKSGDGHIFRPRETGKSNPAANGFVKGINCCLVKNNFVVTRVALLQAFHQHSNAVTPQSFRAGKFTDDTKLPKDQRAARIKFTPPQQEIRCLETLATARSRIHSQVGKQTVFGGDRRQHTRGNSFVARSAHEFVRWEGEYRSEERV